MAYEPPVAVYDACVLYPFHLRNLLIQCAVDRWVEARWTDQIHEEWIRNLVLRTPGLDAARLHRTRDLMKAVLPAADVADYRHLLASGALDDLVDANDRHVVAAAIKGGASRIVTWNLRHFLPLALEPRGLMAIDPDRFLLELYAKAPRLVRTTVDLARRNLRQTTPTASEYFGALERQGLAAFVTLLRET
jgi:hypothetical protein